MAKAAYFPQISLTALLGLESAQLSDLFKGRSRTWAYGADLAQPVFNAGRIRSLVEQARAVQREALYSKADARLDTGGDMVETPLSKLGKFGSGIGARTPGRYLVNKNLNLG